MSSDKNKISICILSVNFVVFSVSIQTMIIHMIVKTNQKKPNSHILVNVELLELLLETSDLQEASGVRALLVAAKQLHIGAHCLELGVRRVHFLLEAFTEHYQHSTFLYSSITYYYCELLTQQRIDLRSSSDCVRVCVSW